jgi:hypothetical protein
MGIDWTDSRVELAEAIPPANPLTNPYGVYYIHNKTTMNRLFNPSAGYIIGEDVAGYTFLDSINFIAQ